MGKDEAGRVIELAGDTEGLLAVRHGLAELAELDEAPDESRDEGCPPCSRIPVVPSIPLELFLSPAKTLPGRSVLPRRLPDKAQGTVHPSLEHGIVGVERESALVQFDGTIRVTHPPDAPRERGQRLPLSACVAYRSGKDLGLTGVVNALCRPGRSQQGAAGVEMGT
jgi:hypothetical protein